MQDYEAPQIRTDWTNRVPTHLVDGVLGHSVANGVYRVIFGEVAFNEEPGRRSRGDHSGAFSC